MSALRGAAAGLVGTAVYTATRPTGAARPSLGATALHWGYGAWGGVLRAGLGRSVHGRPAVDAAHLAVFWGPARMAGGGDRPLGRDLARHAAYVVATGAAYRWLP